MKKRLPWIILIIIFCILPWFLGDYTLYVVSLSLVHIILTVGLNITLGYAGQISLCQASFMGMGAYIMALLLQGGWPFWLILPFSGLIPCFFGAVIAFPALKWKDHYLALITLAFNIITFLVSQQAKEITGGPTGISNIIRPSLGPLKFSSDVNYYYLLLFLVALAIFSSYWVVNSKWGRAFEAMRQNELAAKAHGVSILSYKILAFALGAFYSGVGGALFACLCRYISPDSFTMFMSFEILIMTVIGGMGRIEGPIIGALLITIGPEVLRVAESLYLIIYSVILIFVMLFMRKGLVVVLDRIKGALSAQIQTKR
jgi:branched-chain amino acid transport system permease protein